MKYTKLKSAITAFALSLGAMMIAAPASAECALCDSAENGDFAAIEQILDNRSEVPVDINGRDDKKRTALYLAAKEGHTNIVERLLNDTEQDIDVDSIARKNRTALMQAAKGGFLPIVEFLVNANASINISRKNDNETALKFGGKKQS